MNNCELQYHNLQNEINKSKQKVREFASILGKIKSFRDKHGDSFFNGLTKLFENQPYVPVGESESINLHSSVGAKAFNNKDIEHEASYPR